MQKVYVRKGKAATCDLKKDIEIMHFSLQDALPPGHILALNTKFGTLSYLSYEGDRLQMMVVMFKRKYTYKRGWILLVKSEMMNKPVCYLSTWGLWRRSREIMKKRKCMIKKG